MTLSAVTDYLASVGCEFPEIGLLQPADPILDTAGEDLRRRIYITQENSGTLFCLRPEFTIPVGLHHLEDAKPPTRYGYGGKVFRQRSNEAAEFTQAGFEDLGNANRSSADIETIKTALGVLKAGKCCNAKLVLGDQSIFSTLLDALEIPAVWRKKLHRSFGDAELLANQIAQMSGGNSSGIGVSDDIKNALASSNEAELVEVVTQLMLSDGLPLSGGRTPKAIAERIREKAELGATRLDAEKRNCLESFLSLDIPLNDAGEHLKKFADDFGLSLPGAVEALSKMAHGLSGIDAEAHYRASFGRRLDYYTGLVFELYLQGSDKPVIGGGRYDQLMTLLGSAEEIPAVGFAVWVDRLGDAS